MLRSTRPAALIALLTTLIGCPAVERTPTCNAPTSTSFERQITVDAFTLTVSSRSPIKGSKPAFVHLRTTEPVTVWRLDCSECESPDFETVARLSLEGGDPRLLGVAQQDTTISLPANELPVFLRVMRVEHSGRPLTLEGEMWVHQIEQRCTPKLEVRLQTPATCGNGWLEPGEACDNPADPLCDETCQTAAPTCSEEGPIRVEWVRCGGIPNRCERVACQPESQGRDPETGELLGCPEDLPRASVVVTPRSLGAVEPGSQVTVVGDNGIDCTCEEQITGRVCTGTCQAATAPCTPVTLTVSAPDRQASARWTVGQSAQPRIPRVEQCRAGVEGCLVRAPAKGALQVTAWVDPVASGVESVERFPMETPGRLYEVHHLAELDTGMAIVARHSTPTPIEGVPDIDGRPRFVIAWQKADQHLPELVDLGLDAEVEPIAVAAEGDRLYLLTVEGDLRLFSRLGPDEATEADLPHTWLSIYEGTERVLHQDTGMLWAHAGALAPLTDGAVGVATSVGAFFENGYGGAWTTVAVFEPDGSERWRWAAGEPPLRQWIRAEDLQALDDGGLAVAGRIRGTGEPPAPITEPADFEHAEIFRLDFSAEGALERHHQAVALDVRGQVRLSADDTLVTLDLQRTVSSRTPLLISAPIEGEGWRTPLPADQACQGAHDEVAHIAIDPDSGQIAVAHPICDAGYRYSTTRGVSVRLISPEGELLQIWRLGGDAGEGPGGLTFGGISFMDGQPVISGLLEGQLVGTEVEGEGQQAVVVRLQR